VSLLDELKRRRVFRAVIAYGVVSFAVLQIIEPIMHGLHWPETVLTFVVITLAVVFPIVVGLSWIFEVNAGRIQRTAPAAPGPVVRGGRHASLALPVSVAAAIAIAASALLLRRGGALEDAPQPAQERIVVAVADFANETDDRDLNGLSGMLITSLEQSRRLLVLTRSRMVDVLRELGRADVDRIDESLGREVARRAGAKALVLASIHRFDQVYAIEVKVVDPATNEYLFTLKEQEEGKSRVPEMIDRLSQRAREKLREPPREVRVTQVKIGDAITTNLQAYEHYVRGVQYQESSRLDSAIDEYRSAVAEDPDFAVAHYRIAYAGMFSTVPPSVQRAEIEQAMRRVDRLPEKERLLVQAWKAGLDRNPDLASRLYAEAAGLYAQDKQVPFMAGEYLIHLGRPAAALPYFEQAVALKPTWEWARAHVVDCLLILGRADELLRRTREWMATKPDPDTYRWLARAQLGTRDWQGAAASARSSMKLVDQGGIAGYQTRLTLAEALVYAEHYTEAEALLREGMLPAAPPSERSRIATMLAEVLAYQGRRRDAGQLIQELPGLGANEELARGMRIYHRLAAGQPIAEEIEPLASAGIHRGQLAVMLAWAGELTAAERQAAALDPASPEWALYQALSTWHRGDLAAATVGFSDLARRADLDYAPLASLALGEIGSSRGSLDDAVSALESFRSMYMTAGRGFALGVPPPEFYRIAFAGYFRSDAYPRSLYLSASAHVRLGRLGQARKELEHLLSLWKRADPDLPLLADAKALLREIPQRRQLAKD
jgi:eukaryotic-like serine/threonine-protein kinase